MQLPQIKTYKLNTPKEENQFYVLNKGCNAGRPSHKPNRNCFTVTCNSLEQHDQFYSLCFVLWKGKRFHPYLCGTCIEFLRLSEFKKLLTSAMEKLAKQPGKLEQATSALNRIEAAEKLISQQLHQIQQMKLCLVQFLR